LFPTTRFFRSNRGYGRNCVAVTSNFSNRKGALKLTFHPCPAGHVTFQRNQFSILSSEIWKNPRTRLLSQSTPRPGKLPPKSSAVSDSCKIPRLPIFRLPISVCCCGARDTKPHPRPAGKNRLQAHVASSAI